MFGEFLFGNKFPSHFHPRRRHDKKIKPTLMYYSSAQKAARRFRRNNEKRLRGCMQAGGTYKILSFDKFIKSVS